MNSTDTALIRTIQDHAQPLTGNLDDFDSIVAAARGKSLVLIGEATHGTTEFYHARAQLTQRLIGELGFAGVAVEADWPDAYAINRHVWNLHPDQSAEQAFAVFDRFPAWMWANTEVVDFVRWLAEYNLMPERAAAGLRPVGFYGLDLYSLNNSIRAVIAYLDRVDRSAAARARERYACMDEFLHEPHQYGEAVATGASESCERAINEQLRDMQTRTLQWLERLGLVADEQRFYNQHNARLVRNAEKYYRALFQGGSSAWNVRDQHMFETLEALRKHLGHQLGEPAGVVVWAHNAHVGNAAATEMAERDEFNLGQLVRDKYADQALLVGFSTATGEVTAAADWDGPALKQALSPPLPGSYEALFQAVAQDEFLLDLRSDGLRQSLSEARLQRAIGVVYRPQSERQSHYYHTRLPEQFDFMLHYQHTHALQPMSRESKASSTLAETWPSGL